MNIYELIGVCKEADGTVIGFVKVEIKNGPKVVRDPIRIVFEDGQFIFACEAEGTYEITSEHYRHYDRTMTVEVKGKKTYVDFVLEPIPGIEKIP